MDYEALAMTLYDRRFGLGSWENGLKHEQRRDYIAMTRMAYDAGAADHEEKSTTSYDKGYSDGMAFCKALEKAVFDQGYSHGPYTQLENSLMEKLFCNKHQIQKAVEPCTLCNGVK